MVIEEGHSNRLKILFKKYQRIFFKIVFLFNVIIVAKLPYRYIKMKLDLAHQILFPKKTFT